MHITNITATIKLNAMLNSSIITKIELAERLGITRPTLDIRLSKSNWKKSELHLIKAM